MSYGEYKLQELQLQVEQLHHQLRAAAHDAKYWADRTYSAEIMNFQEHAGSSEEAPTSYAALRVLGDKPGKRR